jgi:hypothetical protein
MGPHQRRFRRLSGAGQKAAQIQPHPLGGDGRDDIAINAACQRIYAALKKQGAPDADWRELYRLWASDFRTHITEARWQNYCRDLAVMEAQLGTGGDRPLPPA